MATVNHVRVNNYDLGLLASKGFEAFWKLTRALKKAGWQYKASSDGTTKESSADPAADLWGSGVTSNAGASAASIAAPARGRAVITGLTGIVAADKGRFLLISGGATGANNNQHQIEEVLSATSVSIDARTFAVASDANNGSLVWSVLDPLADVYSTFTAALDSSIAWWVGRGPSMIKIPITAASAGTLEVGENLVQASTGAEGELVGYTYYNGTGWLSVAPRLRGTGSGVYGWDTANLITGGYSAATVTQDGAALEYAYEVVIGKPASNLDIRVALVQPETVAENYELFSVCATQAGCTPTVPPGAGGTGNAFGAHAWMLWGSNTTALAVKGTSGVLLPATAQYICVDAIPEQNHSADGTWNLFILTTPNTSTPPVGGILYGFNRLDEVEDGELAPYATINPGGNSYSQTSTFGLSATVGTDTCNTTWFFTTLSTSRWAIATWVGRVGVQDERGINIDRFARMEVGILSRMQGTATPLMRAASTPAIRQRSSASPYAKTREPIYLLQLISSTSDKIFINGGRFRWLYFVSGDQVTDVYGTDPAWTQLSSDPLGAMVVGPTDGAAWALSL